MNNKRDIKKKNRRIKFRLTQKNYKVFKSYCQNNNVTMSRLLIIDIKRHIGAKDIVPIYQKEDQVLELLDNHISRIGNNLNQYTRTLNIINKRGEYVGELPFEGIRKAAMDVYDNFVKLKEILIEKFTNRNKNEYKKATLYIRTEEDLFQKFKSYCQKNKVTMSQLLVGDVKKHIGAKDIIPIYYKEDKLLELIDNHVYRIGNNLNQCTRALNIINKTGEYNGERPWERIRKAIRDAYKIFIELENILVEKL